MNRVVASVGCALVIGYFFISSCQKEFSCENCAGSNRPPVANAGHDQFTVLPKDSVILDGTQSKDPDGTITQYIWKNISGPSSFVINAFSSEKTIVKDLAIGNYSFELTVTDNDGLFSSDTIMITVDDVEVNHAPVAVAGNDTTLILPVNSILLDGSNSWDIDNNIIGYAWNQISGPSNATISDPVSVELRVDNMIHGVYRFVLTVTDAGGLFDKDTVQITVNISPNHSPVANAGSDQLITYNLETCSMEPSVITLDGNQSYDVDGTIVSYQWSLISADNFSIIINNPNAPVTTITNLTPGTYKFRLKVADNEGATDDDTTIVTITSSNRPMINAQLVTVGNLSIARKVSAVVTAGNKIFFAGGTVQPVSPGPNFSSRVDIYDISTNSWSIAELSQPRWGLTAATVGNKVYFAGGSGSTGSGVAQTSRIDVYDLSTNFWTTLELPRRGLYSSIVHGNNIYFAGGTAIDIYNTSNDAWSSKSLSQPRYQITPTNMQGKLYFFGGSTTTSGGTGSSRIDMYDPDLNSWSEGELSQPKYGMAGLGMRGQNVLAGGKTDAGTTNEVEIRKPTEVIFSCLFQSNSFSQYSVASSGTNVVFFVSDGTIKDKFDIYDALNDKWSIGVLNEEISPSLVITVNNTVYVVGTSGSGNNGYHDRVWKLQF